MKNIGETVITVDHVSKDFKVYFDKGNSLKEKLIFWKRNRHEKREVLNDVSFTVKKGESIGLIGRNGCGKSTMLKMLTRIYYPNKGKIKVSGRVSSLIELGAGFHPDMTGRENIYINASIYGLTKKEIDARLNDIIDFSELKDFIDNPVRTYSSGMYMRLAFSVAINVDADILLIDEILAVGDSNFQTKCFNKLKELKAEGITIVLVTHSMQSIIDFCEKCIWIEKGKIMGYGATTDITDKYVQYMFNEKITNSVTQQNHKKTNAVQQKEKQLIDTTQNHFGTQTAIITDACLLNKSNQRTGILKTGEPFKISIKYKILNEKFNNIVFGVGINSIDGSLCYYGTNTKIDKFNLKINKKVGEILFICDKLILSNGEYGLNVSIVANDDTPIDFYRCYLRFEVVSNTKSVGNIVLNHSWKIHQE